MKSRKGFIRGKLCLMSDAGKAYEPETEQAIERAAAGERVVVRRHGADLVAVVPLQDLHRLQELEAAHEKRAAEKHLIDEARRRVLSSEANRHVLTELAKR